jgi:hypothetical protein
VDSALPGCVLDMFLDERFLAQGPVVDFFGGLAAGFVELARADEPDGDAVLANGDEPDPARADGKDEDAGASGTDGDRPLGVASIIPERDILNIAGIDDGYFHGAAENADMPGGIDEVLCFDGSSVGEGQCVDPVEVLCVSSDRGHFDLFVDIGPEFAGVVEEDFIVDGSFNLERGPDSLACECGRAGFIDERGIGDELEIPEVGVCAPAVGRAEFDGKVCGFNLVPAAHFAEDRADERQLAFADMLAWELGFLEDADAEVGLYLRIREAQVDPAGPPPTIATSNRSVILLYPPQEASDARSSCSAAGILPETATRAKHEIGILGFRAALAVSRR